MCFFQTKCISHSHVLGYFNEQLMKCIKRGTFQPCIQSCARNGWRDVGYSLRQHEYKCESTIVSWTTTTTGSSPLRTDKKPLRSRASHLLSHCIQTEATLATNAKPSMPWVQLDQCCHQVVASEFSKEHWRVKRVFFFFFWRIFVT